MTENHPDRADKSVTYQNIVFNGQLNEVVPEFSDTETNTDGFFSNIKLFASEEERQHLQKSLLTANQSLLNTPQSYTKLIIDLLGENKTPYLSDQIIDNLLASHPPHKLYKKVSPKCIKNLSPRALLSLTRYTESREWKQKYTSLLSKLESSDFTDSLPFVESIDADDIVGGNEILSAKPWGVTHSKETGVILFINTSNTTSSTSELLKLTVFLHYLYEVSIFSKNLENKAGHEIGLFFEKMTTAREKYFNFLTDCNAHDETLYWHQAFNETCKLTTLDQNLFDENTMSLVQSNKTIHSLNFVDILWEMNGLYQNKPPIYHLQQEVWYQLLKYLHKGESESFEDLVSNSIDLDNREFLIL